MTSKATFRRWWPGPVRLIIGSIWIAGALFNLLVTMRMTRPFEWLEESPVPVYRWFFGDIAAERPVLWTVMLAAGEIALGILTFARGGWARIGLAGGALFSLFLFSLGTVYTLVMGPYAVLLGWLAARERMRDWLDWPRAETGRRAPTG